MNIRKLVIHTTMTLFFSMTFMSCITKNRIKKIFSQNPELIFNVIREYPEMYIETSTKANDEAYRLAAARRIDEEFKNPKEPQINDDRAIRGNPLAPITIVEYSDFQCGYCQLSFSTIESIRKKYGDKVRFMLKHLPMSSHDMASTAARYFEAISLQSGEKAYLFHDELFNNQNQIKTERGKFLDKIVLKVNADLKRVRSDIKSELINKRIEEDRAEAKKFNINGTPTFLINGVVVIGAQPALDFERIIDRWLH